MSVGLGIFLVCFILGFVALFIATKDRWNWTKLILWPLVQGKQTAKSLDNPTKLLLAGALFAALIFGIGAVNTSRLTQRLQELEAACLEDRTRDEDLRRERERTGLDLEPVCEGRILSEIDSQQKRDRTEPLASAPSEIAAAYDELQHAVRTDFLALVVLVLSALPWAWYFLLGRIRELRDVVVGK